jgi:small-conductance mechanosensitive channel
MRLGRTPSQTERRIPLRRFRSGDNAARTLKTPSPAQVGSWVRSSRFRLAVTTGVGAFIVLVVGSIVKNWRFDVPGWRHLVEIAPPLVFLFLAIPCVRATAHELDEMARRRGGRGAASSIRLITTMVGYLIALVLALGLTDYPLGHLLLGGAIVGVILGIAAQQSLGNVFAGLVLLAARPFTVGNYIRVRSGALGGEFYGTVLSLSLTYVTMATPEGVLKVPNLSVMAAAVGPFTRPTSQPRNEAATEQAQAAKEVSVL